MGTRAGWGLIACAPASHRSIGDGDNTAGEAWRLAQGSAAVAMSGQQEPGLLTLIRALSVGHNLLDQGKLFGEVEGRLSPS